MKNGNFNQNILMESASIYSNKGMFSPLTHTGLQ